jgi:phospholipase C
MYWVSGTSGGARSESVPTGGFDLPTIFDRLEERGVSWKFYVQNYDSEITFRNPGLGERSSQVLSVPLLGFRRFLDTPRLRRKIVDLDRYFEDLQQGTLPSVAYIVPSGPSEHPPGRIQAGQRFVRSLITALKRSSYWKSSAFMWTYDHWGGWYDHVRPPRVDASGYGFRVPALLVSPYAKRGHVDSTTLDFTSILKFIERNWRLRPLASRDRRAKTFTSAFDFEAQPRPPRLLSLDRASAGRAKEPRRPVIYAAYSLALVVAGLTVTMALRPSSRRRRKGEERQ